MKTNKEILKEAQVKILDRSILNPDYPIEARMRDMDLITDLTLLIIKYRDKDAEDLKGYCK